MAKVLKLFADYRQLHVIDEGASGSLAEAWSVKAVEDCVCAAPGIVGIGTQDAVTVRVSVECLEGAPEDVPPGDHVTSASLLCRSGRVLVMGCTDEVTKAFRLEVPAGPLRVMSVHRIGRTETVQLLVWPAPLTDPVVHVRYLSKPQKRAPSKKKVDPVLDAARLARRGETAAALAQLIALSDAGDPRAAGGAAELLAYQERYQEAAEHSLRVLAQGDSFGASNPFLDHCRLLRLFSESLAEPALIARGAALTPKKFEGMTQASLLNDSLLLDPLTAEQLQANQGHMDQALAQPSVVKRFKERPLELAAHTLALAAGFRLDDRLVQSWDESNPRLGFDAAVKVAAAFMRLGREEDAWNALQSRLAEWRPNHHGGCAPVEPLTVRELLPLMTPARRQLLLRSPRAIDLA